MRSFLYAKKHGGNAMHMWFFIVLFIVLFLILLLSMPLIVEARMRFGLRGAAVHAKVYVLGLIPIPVRLRIRLLSAPYFTLCFGRKRTSLFQRPKSGAEGILEGMHIRNLRIAVTLGVRDDPARATWYAGVLGVAFTMLIPRVAETGSVKVCSAKDSVFRLSLACSALVQPLEALRGFHRSRRIARANAANNSRKPEEKRNEYASC